ncbi:hypothetical protein ACRARG_04550 [Pseudooceanicola sp. C21-150M6]|uniref:hypothetical protein n=1 Tax=Pseudooceanicola sp. C21-150M6 TaxID=3434355 RepID=UPI003D7F7E09
MITFAASVRGWTQKATENAEHIIRGATQDVGELMTRRQASVKDTGGTFQVGFVPVDTGELINSQQVSINGGVIGQGDVSYAALVAGMDLGDVFEAVFTALHARPQEYGVTGKFAGRFFVRNAVQQWSVIVAQNAAQFKD